jgi:hypothetical protein
MPPEAIFPRGRYRVRLLATATEARLPRSGLGYKKSPISRKITGPRL